MSRSSQLDLSHSSNGPKLDPLKLLDLAKKGWLPGPGESEETFIERINVQTKLLDEFEEEKERAILLKKGSEITQKTFGFRIDWVPILFSNQKLSFWEGAAAWIFEEGIGGKGAYLQLRKKLKKKKYLFQGLYSSEELVSHELVHVARMAYEEPLFEEILAYRTSSSNFRKKWGPLFASSSEVRFFLLFLLLPLISVFQPILSLLFWIFPLSYVVYLCCRLYKNHQVFQKKMGEVSDPLALLLMTDKDFTGTIYLTDLTPREKLLKYLLNRSNLN